MAAFLDSYLPYLLQRADQLLSRRFHRDLHAEGIAVSEWRVLAMLRESGESSLSMLTEATMLPQPTATHAVTRLEADGLVVRRRGTTDKRQRFVGLTVAGEELAGRLEDLAADRCEGMLDGVDAAVVERVRADVTAIIARLAVAPPPSA